MASQTKDKLSKRERLGVLYQIDKTLNGFCHVCPYFGHNTPHQNCRKCPIEDLLQDYGKQLGWVEHEKPAGVSWTDEEDYVIRNNFGKLPVTQIAEKLGRSYVSVSKRIRRLRENGIL